MITAASSRALKLLGAFELASSNREICALLSLPCIFHDQRIYFASSIHIRSPHCVLPSNKLFYSRRSFAQDSGDSETDKKKRPSQSAGQI